MEAYTLAIDLKITPDNRISILEIMPAHYAGFKGYKAVNDRDMLRDAVFPGLKKLNRRFFYADNRNEYDKITADPALSHTGGALIYLPQGGLIHDFYRKDAANGPHCLINADLDFLVAADNKAVFHRHMNQVTGGTPADILLPPTYVGHSAYTRSLAQDIRSAIGIYPRYVLKAPDTAHGTGLRLIDGADLDDALKSLFPPEGRAAPLLSRTWDGIDPAADYWRRRPAPVFVIQPCITGKTLYREGYAYDGTMRVTLTAYRKKTGGAFRIMRHDGYWKLPPEPLRVKEPLPPARSIVSYSCGNREKKQPGFLAAFFNGLSAPRGWRPPDSYMAPARDDLDLVYDRLEEIMPSFMDHLCRFDVKKAARNGLFSDDKMHQALGVMIALDGGCAPYRFDDFDVDSGSSADEAEILERLRQHIKSGEITAVKTYAEALVTHAAMTGSYGTVSLPKSLITAMAQEKRARVRLQNLSTVAHDLHNHI